MGGTGKPGDKLDVEQALGQLRTDNSVWRAVYEIAPVNNGMRFVQFAAPENQRTKLEELVRNHMNTLFEPKERVEILNDALNQDFAGYLRARTAAQHLDNRVTFTLAYLENYTDVLDFAPPQPTGRVAYTLSVPANFFSEKDGKEQLIIDVIGSAPSRLVDLYRHHFEEIASRTGVLGLDLGHRDLTIIGHVRGNTTWMKFMEGFPDALDERKKPSAAPSFAARAIPPAVSPPKRDSAKRSPIKSDTPLPHSSSSLGTNLSDLLTDTTRITYAMRTIQDLPEHADGQHKSTILYTGPKTKGIVKVVEATDLVAQKKFAQDYPGLASDLGFPRAGQQFEFFYYARTAETAERKLHQGMPFVSPGADGNSILIGYAANDVGPAPRPSEFSLALISLDKALVKPDKFQELMYFVNGDPERIVTAIEAVFHQTRPKNGWKLDKEHFRDLRFLEPPRAKSPFRHWHSLDEFLALHVKGMNPEPNIAQLPSADLVRYLATSRNVAHALLGNFTKLFTDMDDQKYDLARGNNMEELHDFAVFYEMTRKHLPSLFPENGSSPAYRARIAAQSTEAGYRLYVSFRDPHAGGAKPETTYIAFIDEKIAPAVVQRLRKDEDLALELMLAVYPWADRSNQTLVLDQSYPHNIKDPQPVSDGKADTGRLEKLAKEEGLSAFELAARYVDTPHGKTDMFYEFDPREGMVIASMIGDYAVSLDLPHPDDPSKPAVVGDRSLLTKLQKAYHVFDAKKGQVGGLQGDRYFLVPEEISTLHAVVAGIGELHHEKEGGKTKRGELYDSYRKFRIAAMARLQEVLHTDAAEKIDPSTLSLRQRYDRAIFENLKTQDDMLRIGPRLDDMIRERDQYKEAYETSVKAWEEHIKKLKGGEQKP